MNSFIVRQKGTKNKFLEGFHSGAMSNFMSITTKGWLDFEGLLEIKDYFKYMEDTLLIIGAENSNKLAATKRQLKKLSNFEILEVSDKTIINAFDILNLDKFDFTNIVITKDNIHLYYGFMSDEDLEQYRATLDEVFQDRFKYIANELFNFNSMSDNEIIELVNKCDTSYETGLKKDNIDYILKFKMFEIKDTLKPINEYIAQIRKSDEYKEYTQQKDF